MTKAFNSRSLLFPFLWEELNWLRLCWAWQHSFWLVKFCTFGMEITQGIWLLSQICRLCWSQFGNYNLSFHVSELVFLSVEFFFSFTINVFFYMFQTWRTNSIRCVYYSVEHVTSLSPLLFISKGTVASLPRCWCDNSL